MKRLRVRIIILASWLLFIFIFNRLLDPLAISNTAIAFVFIMATTALYMPRKPVIPLWVIATLPIIALITVKLWGGYLSGDLGISLAIIEACMIVFTIVLSNWVNAALNEFESSVAQITLGQREKTQEVTLTGLGAVYREVRRARNHQRPLALISIGVEEKSIELVMERMVQETQLAMMKQFKLQGLSKMLCDQLEDCAVIVRDSDRFLAVLPETLPEEIPFVLERLRQKANEQVNVELKIGAALLAHDSYTFEGLVDIATRSMESDKEPQSYVVLDPHRIEHRVN